MKSWQLSKGATSLDALHLQEIPKPEPGPGEVLIRVRACSINYRDQLIPLGQYMGGAVDRDITPLSDGAGVVEAVGAGVTRFKAGDRVAGPSSRTGYLARHMPGSVPHWVRLLPRGCSQNM